jgi:septin family protein
MASSDDGRSWKLRKKAARVRILVMGRANAGKTTILQKVCNTADRPKIFDSRGKKVSSATQRSAWRDDADELFIIRSTSQWSCPLHKLVLYLVESFVVE